MISADLKEFIELLNSRRVEYVIAGAHCVAFPRPATLTGTLTSLFAPPLRT